VREVEPLCLAFWGGAWTLGSWCRLREGFRSFRPDRIDLCEPTGEVFTARPGGDLPAYLEAMRSDYSGLG
jgi:predicted DNA-binding transcriptional regulator YafY